MIAGRTSIDDSEYLSMKDGVQGELQVMHPDLFRIVTKVSPDKKAIRAALEDGAEVPGFQLMRSQDRFEFRVEDVK